MQNENINDLAKEKRVRKTLLQNIKRAANKNLEEFKQKLEIEHNKSQKEYEI